MSNQTSMAETRRRIFRDVVGLRLRELREERGLSMAKLADLAGVSESTINNAEQGQTYSFYLAAKCAEALDCAIDDLAPTEAT